MEQLRILFEIAKDLTDDTLTDEQLSSAFRYATMLFFGVVSIRVEVADLTELEQYGSYKIVNEIATSDDTTIYKIVPNDIDSFKIPFNYHGDFVEVCKFVILDTSMQNINKLKNLGVAEIPLQNETKEAIKQYLISRYNIQGGTTVL